MNCLKNRKGVDYGRPNANTQNKICTICKKELSFEEIQNCKKDSCYQHRECRRLYQLQYHRKYCVGSIRDGIRIDIYGNKRPYPKDEKCELCKL